MTECAYCQSPIPEDVLPRCWVKVAGIDEPLCLECRRITPRALQCARGDHNYERVKNHLEEGESVTALYKCAHCSARPDIDEAFAMAEQDSDEDETMRDMKYWYAGGRSRRP